MTTVNLTRRDSLGVYHHSIPTTDARSRDTLITTVSPEESEEATKRLIALIGFNSGTVWNALSGLLDAMPPAERETVYASIDNYRSRDRSARTADGRNDMHRLRDATRVQVAGMNAAAKRAWSAHSE